MAYGSKGFPWRSEFCHREVNYQKGICPVAETLHDQSFLGYQMCLDDLTDNDVDLIIATFKKVWSGLAQLR